MYTYDTAVKKWLLENRDNILKDLAALISIPSVRKDPENHAPFGADCLKALEAGSSLAQRMGMNAEISDDRFYVMANWGSGDKTIGFFTHLDVVDAGAGWKTPPFTLTNNGAYVAGRGVSDNKNGVISALYTVKAFRDLQIPLKSKLFVYMGGCEETGMEDIDHYIAQNSVQPDFSIVADSMFPVCNAEYGIFDFNIPMPKPFEAIIAFSSEAKGSLACKNTDFATATLPYAKETADYLEDVCAKSKWLNYALKDNRLCITATGVARLISMPSGAVDATCTLCKALLDAPGISAHDKHLLKTLYALIFMSNGNGLGLGSKVYRNKVFFNVVKSTKTDNGLLTLTMALRYDGSLKGCDVSAVCESHLQSLGLCAQTIRLDDGYAIPCDDPRIEALTDTLKYCTDSSNTAPITLGGATYARKLASAVGFGPHFGHVPQELPTGHGMPHQPDEALILEEFFNAIRIYTLSVIELDKCMHES